MLSFTKALPLFLLIVVAVSILIQIIDRSKKSSVGFQNSKCNKAYIKGLAWAMYSISLLGAVLAWLTLAKVHMLYLFYVLAPLVPATLLLLEWRCGKISMAIASLILWYFMLEVPPIPRDFLFIVENVHMTRTMIFYGMWIPEKAHNTAYALFPTIAFTHAALSMITGMPWYNYFAIAPIFLAWTISLSVLTHLFVRTTSNSNISIKTSLTLILLTLIPQIYIFGHAYQIPAMIMWLISIIFFIRFTLHSNSLAEAFLSILTFTAAIITHPSSIVALGYMLAFSFVIFLSGQFRIISTSPKRYSNKRISSLLATLFTVFVVRAIYDTWYAVYVGQLGLSGITELIDFMLGYEKTYEMLAPSIYDVSGIPFYYAYTWALIPGLALGKTLYDLAFKKKLELYELSYILTATIFVGLGFLWGAIIRGVTSQLYRASYVAFVFFIPVAVALGSGLRSKEARGILLLMIVVASAVILRDPEISLVGRLESRGIPLNIVDIQSDPSNIIQASIIVSRVEELGTLDYIGLYSTTQLKYGRITAYGKVLTQMYNPLADAMYKVLYIKGFTAKDAPQHMPYIMTQPDISKSSIIYNSFVHYCLI